MKRKGRRKPYRARQGRGAKINFQFDRRTKFPEPPRIQKVMERWILGRSRTF